MIIPKGTSVDLDPQELYLSCMVGVRRRIASVCQGYQERHGADKQPEHVLFYMNVMGAMAELAFAKLTGNYWPASLNAPKTDPDVFPDWQVRSSDNPNRDLIVRPNDLDHFKYAVMTVEGYRFVFRGWMYGHETRQDHWLKDPQNRNSPAHFVPQEFLRDIS